MISRKKWLLAAAGALATLTFGAPAAMAGTVVAVTGPSAGDYPVGTQIGDTQRITLASGDRLTVLDNGGTRVFSGPGTFILARQGRQSQNRAFSALTQQRQARRARTGAVRGVKTDKARPNLWYVDVATAGKMCVADPTRLRLWRGDTDFERPYAITAVAQPDMNVEVTFHAGEMLAGWDPRLALTEGLIYKISPLEAVVPPAEEGADGEEAAMPEGKARPVDVDFVVLEEVPETPEELAAALIENGCMTQLEILSEAMAEN